MAYTSRDLHHVCVHVHTHSSGVIMLPHVGQVFAIPDPQRRMMAEEEWGLIVGEDQFLVMQGVSSGKVVPQSSLQTAVRI